jgi:lipoprotein signal peptidase
MASCRDSFRFRVDLPASVHADGDVAGLIATVLDLSRSGIGIACACAGGPGVGQTVRVAVHDLDAGRPVERQWSGHVMHAREGPAGVRVGIAFDWPDGRPGARPRSACPARSDPPWSAHAADADAEASWISGVSGATALTFAGFAADQLSKTWAGSANLGIDGVLDLVPGLLSVAPEANFGALASLAEGLPLTGPLCALGGLALVGLSRRHWQAGALGGALLAAGVLGNSADRLVLGHVRDFLVSGVLPHWTFNLADVLIVAGALTLIVTRPRSPVLLLQAGATDPR